MTVVPLRPVKQGVCSFCLRSLPLDHLHRIEVLAEGLLCNDGKACIAEYERQESVQWVGHVAFSEAS